MRVNSDWTVLCYFDGHGGVQHDVDRSVRELERVGSTDSVQLMAQVTGEDGSCYATHVGKSKLLGLLPTSRPMAHPAESDPSSPQALAEAIVKAGRSFPSKHLMVVLRGHGAAFKGLLPNTETGSRMKLQGLKTALDAAKAALGRPIDMLVLDSCLMGNAETAFVVKDSVRYLAASEELLAGDNLRYDKLARGLEGADLEGAVDAVMAARQNRRLSTASVIDCSKMDELAARMQPMAQSVQAVNFERVQHFRQPAVQERRSGARSRSSELSQMRDLTSLAIEAGEEQLAGFVRDRVVVRHTYKEGLGLDNSHGLSIYAPTGEPAPEYADDLLARSTGWLGVRL